jgi:hypothetical protein
MINKNTIVSVEKKFDFANQFCSYRVIFDTDKVCGVPNDKANTDYQAIQEWIADGGTVIDNGGSE